MFENPRRGRQARNFTTNIPKILVLKSSSEQIFSRKLPLGAPDSGTWYLYAQQAPELSVNPLHLLYVMHEKKEKRQIFV